ncbi:GbsR/MarR family transcriptional regulator [Myceligenerans pegani]|uniref:MarR family transcriptional regulator n=1 Tax=Myceligenerans pegani TaxID=2776917 RepID=A0ABR9MX47_9MICO|nr:MarR family transcriptional regulator [Myceligenerans sp. TRM 65318]MBE1875955.1 MarR family transcriptional regulator [Myceligenerans sp. TRM 65318]MBE3018226.1 MarR family transcriptional regulator [Myceligenerans sp. TRM 65318]
MDPDVGRRYAQEVGLVLAQMGTTPAFGTLLGWLLVCDPPRQTAVQIREAVGLSKASVSTGMRALEQSGMVRRVPAEGRGHAYEIHPDAFTRAIDPTAKMRAFIDVMQRGLDLMGDEDAPQARRLRHTRDVYAYMIERIPALLDEFRAREAREEEG